jgi:hypothetical protein
MSSRKRRSKADRSFRLTKSGRKQFSISVGEHLSLVSAARADFGHYYERCEDLEAQLAAERKKNANLWACVDQLARQYDLGPRE